MALSQHAAGHRQNGGKKAECDHDSQDEDRDGSDPVGRPAKKAAELLECLLHPLHP